MTLLRFVPHFLLLFGVLADAFTYEGVYWTGTMVGVVSTFAAPWLDAIGGGVTAMLAKLFTKEPAATTGGLLAGMAKMRGGGEYLGCSLMSEGKAGSVPQTLTVSASILAYYIFDLIFNMSVVDAAGAIVAALMLFGGQTMAISGCLDEGKTMMAAVFAGIYGIIIGGTCYALISSWGPGYLPSTVLVGSITSGGGAKGRKGSGAGRQGDLPPSLANGSGDPATPSTCALT